MNKFKKIITGSDVIETKVNGINAIANVVKVTLGPKGSNVIIEKSYGSPIVTKDGVTVAKEVFLEDKGANLIAQLMKESSAKTAEVAGDGTTTATVLTQALLIEGQKAISSGVSPTDVKLSLQAASDLALNILQQRVIQCNDEASIFNVATISSNGDKKIGQLISNAIKSLGKHGTVTVLDGKGFDDELEIVDGIRINRGFISPHFVAEGKQTIELENAYVLLSDKKITSARDIVPTLEKTAKDGRQLLIMAEDVADEALHLLIVNNMRGIVKVVAVKAPGFGDKRKELLDDLAVTMGATTVSKEVGKFSEPDNLLGFAAKIQVRKNDTTFIRGSNDEEAVQRRIAMIQEQMADATSKYEQEQYQERIATLSQGIAVIRVGGATESAINEKKYRIDDALQATKAAIDEGVVAGGGVTMIAIQKALIDSLSDTNNLATNNKLSAGVRILAAALEYPCRQILINAGQKPDIIIKAIQDNKEDNFGYNAATQEYGNMINMGVIDPTKVTRCSIQTAVSVASLILNTECIIVDSKNDDDKNSPSMPMM